MGVHLDRGHSAAAAAHGDRGEGSAHLFAPRTAFQWGEPPINGGSNGQKLFQAPSPQYGADIWYRVAQGTGRASVVIQDAKGDTMATLNPARAAPVCIGCRGTSVAVRRHRLRSRRRHCATASATRSA
jgi:hypothetical protein